MLVTSKLRRGGFRKSLVPPTMFTDRWSLFWPCIDPHVSHSLMGRCVRLLALTAVSDVCQTSHQSFSDHLWGGEVTCWVSSGKVFCRCEGTRHLQWMEGSRSWTEKENEEMKITSRHHLHLGFICKEGGVFEPDKERCRRLGVCVWIVTCGVTAAEEGVCGVQLLFVSSAASRTGWGEEGGGCSWRGVNIRPNN